MLSEKEKEINSLRQEVLRFRELYEREQRRCQALERRRQEDLHKWRGASIGIREAEQESIADDAQRWRRTTDSRRCCARCASSVPAAPDPLTTLSATSCVVSCSQSVLFSLSRFALLSRDEA